MAKKQIVSFSLGEDIIEIIDKVKVDKKLNSRSQAIERIVLSYESNAEDIKSMVYEMVSQIVLENGINLKNNDKPKPSQIEEKAMDEVQQAALAAMDDIFSNMPIE